MPPSFIMLAKTLLIISSIPSLLNLSIAAPAQGTDSQSHSLSKRADKPSQGQIDSANGIFPGIDWSYTAENGGCDSGQFALLVEATRMALEIMEFSGHLLQHAFETTGFHRYFMRHGEWGNVKDFDLAHAKYAFVKAWPVNTPKGIPAIGKLHIGAQSQSGATTAAEAQESPPPTHQGSTPLQVYINDITATPNREIKNIDDLNSYEHTLIHEWYHNQKTDPAYRYQVVDLKGDYGQGVRDIYRSYACQRYAWRHVLKGGGIGDIEKTTMYNADNWAWMFSYNWYKSIYKWNDDGSIQQEIRLKNRQEDPEATEDPNKDAPLDPDAIDGSTALDTGVLPPEKTTYDPEKCPGCMVTKGGCVIVSECRFPQPDGTVDEGCTHCTCDIDRNDNSPSTVDVSLEDDRCSGWLGKLPNGYKFPPENKVPADFNCNCGENGCTADSAPCCGNGSCECHCNESGCAKEDPACCANGSCHFGTMKMLKMF